MPTRRSDTGLERQEDYDLLCIFDLQPFVDPVRAEDGKTYSRANIERYFASQEAQGKPITSPWTRAEMDKRLVPDAAAAGAVEKRWHGVLNFKALIPGARSIHDLGEVFATLDSVRDRLADFLDGWQPPQLVMVGKESSGKSSVLERLCMMPIFPRADNVCTRTPIHVRLRNSKACKAPTLEVFNTKTKRTEEGPHIIPTEIGAIDVKAKMDEVLQKEGNQRLSMDRIIIIKITSPYVPSIDLVDMPGLVTSPAEDRDRTRQLLTEHINAHGKYSLYLATVTADDAPNTAAAMEFVQAHNLQPRTVGVFTMVDEVVPRKWDIFMKRLQEPNEEKNGGVPIEPHGWVPVINAVLKEGDAPCTKGGSSVRRLAKQALDEEECLQAKMPEIAAAGKAGCRALVDKLHALFYDFLEKEWAPKTVRMLQAATEPLLLENAALGMPEFHQAGTQAKARDSAVFEARSRLTDKATTLIDMCCTNVLGALKVEVQKVFDSQASQCIPAVKLPAFLKEHRSSVRDKCLEFVKKWAEHWVCAVRRVLESHSDDGSLDNGALGGLRNPHFKLERFPTFIEAILEELKALLGHAQKRLRHAVASCLVTFYGRMSFGMRLSSDLQPPVPQVTVTFDADVLIENVVLAFVEEGDMMISGELCGKLDQVAASIEGSEAWIESCAAERVALLAKIGELQRAQGEILRAVLKVRSLEEMEERLTLFQDDADRDPSVVPCLPASYPVHADVPVACADDPATHTEHTTTEVAPTTPEDIPAAHMEHAVGPVDAPCEPGSHVAHPDDLEDADGGNDVVYVGLTKLVHLLDRAVPVHLEENELTEEEDEEEDAPCDPVAQLSHVESPTVDANAHEEEKEDDLDNNELETKDELTEEEDDEEGV